MIALEFPQSPFKPEDLADWLELTAIFSADKNASAGDVERGLNLLNHPNAGDLLGNMLTEIDRRNTAAGENAYPFIRQNTSVELKPDPHNYPAYIFCLGAFHILHGKRGRVRDTIHGYFLKNLRPTLRRIISEGM